LIFYIRDEFEYEFGVVPISLLPIPYLCFKIGENSNHYPTSVKAGKTRHIEFDSGGYLQLRKYEFFCHAY